MPMRGRSGLLSEGSLPGRPASLGTDHRPVRAGLDEQVAGGRDEPLVPQTKQVAPAGSAAAAKSASMRPATEAGNPATSAARGGGRPPARPGPRGGGGGAPPQRRATRRPVRRGARGAHRRPTQRRNPATRAV